jgi:hypothetical protein
MMALMVFRCWGTRGIFAILPQHYVGKRYGDEMGQTDIDKRRLKDRVVLPDFGQLPVRVPRDVAAELLTRYFFETSPRTLERWPLRWRRLNGRAHCETRDLFAIAQSKLAAAPAVMSGRQSQYGNSV